MNVSLLVCRNCGKPATKPRQLCRKCYDDRAIRNRTPSLVGRRTGKRYVTATPTPRKKPTLPCYAPPGHPCRINAYRLRAALGQFLWFAKDAPEGDHPMFVGEVALSCDVCGAKSEVASTGAIAEALADLDGWDNCLGVHVCPRCKHNDKLPDVPLRVGIVAAAGRTS